MMTLVLLFYIVGCVVMAGRLALDFLVEPTKISPIELLYLFVVVLIWPVTAPVTIYLARQWRLDMRKGKS